MRTLSERLKWLRTTADNVSAREASKLAGLRQGHVALIESGERSGVAAETVRSLAAVFGVSMDWLFSGFGKAPDVAAVRAAVTRAQRRHAATGTEG